MDLLQHCNQSPPISLRLPYQIVVLAFFCKMFQHWEPSNQLAMVCGNHQFPPHPRPHGKVVEIEAAIPRRRGVLMCSQFLVV